MRKSIPHSPKNSWRRSSNLTETAGLGKRRSVGRRQILEVRSLRRRLRARQLAQELKKGALSEGFSASGDDFGFTDILGCAEFLDRQVTQTWHHQSRRRVDDCDDSSRQELDQEHDERVIRSGNDISLVKEC